MRTVYERARYAVQHGMLRTIRTPNTYIYVAGLGEAGLHISRYSMTANRWEHIQYFENMAISQIHSFGNSIYLFDTERRKVHSCCLMNQQNKSITFL